MKIASAAAPASKTSLGPMRRECDPSTEPAGSALLVKAVRGRTVESISSLFRAYHPSCQHANSDPLVLSNLLSSCNLCSDIGVCQRLQMHRTTPPVEQILATICVKARKQIVATPRDPLRPKLSPQAGGLNTLPLR